MADGTLQAGWGLIRTGGLALALAGYGLLSAPAPAQVGLRELPVAIGLVLAVGPVRPVLLGTGALLVARDARPYEVAGTLAFLYLLWIPLLRAVLLGTALPDVVRDVVPLIYLFLPVLLVPSGPLGRRVLLWGVVAVGVAFALRWWWPGMAFQTIGRKAMEEGGLYLLNSPAVLFAAVWLPLAAVRRMAVSTPTLPVLIGRGTVALGLLGSGALAGAALAGAVHRAALVMAALAFGWFFLSRIRRAPLAASAMLAGAALVALVLGDTLAGAVDQVVRKTETYGLNARSDETVAVLDQVGQSWDGLLFGLGWGALIRNPAVGERYPSSSRPDSSRTP
jgi:hypothetical protein